MPPSHFTTGKRRRCVAEALLRQQPPRFGVSAVPLAQASPDVDVRSVPGRRNQCTVGSALRSGVADHAGVDRNPRRQGPELNPCVLRGRFGSGEPRATPLEWAVLHVGFPGADHEIRGNRPTGGVKQPGIRPASHPVDVDPAGDSDALRKKADQVGHTTSEKGAGPAEPGFGDVVRPVEHRRAVHTHGERPIHRGEGGTILTQHLSPRSIRVHRQRHGGEVAQPTQLLGHFVKGGLVRCEQPRFLQVHRPRGPLQEGRPQGPEQRQVLRRITDLLEGTARRHVEPQVQHEPVLDDRAASTARLWVPVKDHHLEPVDRQSAGSRKAGQASPDHRHLPALSTPPPKPTHRHLRWDANRYLDTSLPAYAEYLAGDTADS